MIRIETISIYTVNFDQEVGATPILPGYTKGGRTRTCTQRTIDATVGI
jgi:hypothetical protein